MWGFSHSHLSVICFLKSCAVTLAKQPLGLFRCCVSSEETEYYALPRIPSTPTPKIISTNPQDSCFTTVFNFNEFQNTCKTTYKRPVTTATTKQKPAKKTSKTCKSAEIYYQFHKNPLTNPYFHPITANQTLPTHLNYLNHIEQHTQTSKRPVNAFTTFTGRLYEQSHSI